MKHDRQCTDWRRELFYGALSICLALAVSVERVDQLTSQPNRQFQVDAARIALAQHEIDAVREHWLAATELKEKARFAAKMATTALGVGMQLATWEARIERETARCERFAQRLERTERGRLLGVEFNKFGLGECSVLIGYSLWQTLSWFT